MSECFVDDPFCGGRKIVDDAAAAAEAPAMAGPGAELLQQGPEEEAPPAFEDQCGMKKLEGERCGEECALSNLCGLSSAG
jgi:hypothetical protein